MSVLFSEKPYAAAVSPEYFLGGKICFSCFKRPTKSGEALKKCSKCHIAAYCDKKCQRKDFENDQHRRECPVFQKISENLRPILEANEILRLICRIFARKFKDGGRADKEDLKGFPVGENLRDLSDMQTNKVQVGNSKEYAKAWKIFQLLYAGNSKFFGTQFTQENFAEIMGLAQSNMFSIYDYDLTQGQVNFGSGIYIQSSRFNHSCCPDLGKYMIGSERFVKKIKGLNADFPRNLDSLTINYCQTSTIQFAEDRQKALGQYFFTCQCPDCLNSRENNMRKFSLNKFCPNCRGILLLSGEILECSRCENFPKNAADQEIVALISKLEKAHLGEQEINENPQEFVKKAEKILHPVRNLHLLHLREEAFMQAEQLYKTFVEHALLKDMYEYGVGMLASYDFYNFRASAHPVLCLKMAELAFVDKRRPAAILYYEKAQKLWSEICYPEHDLIKEIQGKVEKVREMQSQEQDLQEFF